MATNPSPAEETVAPMPRIVGPWRRLVGPPDLEKWATGREQAVDFTIFRAADGTWQFISCIRGTAHPGGGRLLYRWEAEDLTDDQWRPIGIFATSDRSLGHVEGRMQAPHCVKVGDTWYMYYNSNGAHCLVSRDGKDFEHRRNADGGIRLFAMGRDVMLFDNTARDGKWYALYTQVVAGRYPERNGHTIGYRTAPTIEGPWSDPPGEMPVLTPPTPGDRYNFIDAESPFVLYRNGWYYRLEQMNVAASRSVDQWDGLALRCLTGDNPRHRYAPEIIEDQGRMYIAGYRYSETENGIYIAELIWPDG